MLELADPDVLMLLGATGAPEATATTPPRAASRSFDHAISVATDRAAFDALAADWTELDGTAEGATSSSPSPGAGRYLTTIGDAAAIFILWL